MNIRTSRLCVQTSVWVLASAFCVTGLTGCGATGNFTQGLGPDSAVQGLHGTVHGGPNPVIGAAVTLYATSTVASPTAGNNYGYGQPGVALGSTTTNSSGDFTLTGDAASCPAGQQAYIVASGGHTSSSTANSAALLMAALGPCGSGLTNTTPVIIDEPTTIAAAYALSGFMTLSGTTVQISAPANNNATTAACTVVSNATTGCAASGLAHAFLNAATLVNSSTGVANSTVTNPSTLVVTVPQPLINTLANSVEACVNSNGTITGTTAPCAILMTNATPTEVASATAPTNTLQALLDLALYPSMATGSGNAGPPLGATAGDANPSAATTALFNVANSNAYYSPALTAAPDDFTIAVNYAMEPVPGTEVAVWGLGTDIKDNVYAYAHGATGTIYSIASDGVQNWDTASTTTCGFSTTGARCVATADTLGNVWVTDSAGLTEFNATSGVQGTTYTTGDSIHMALVDEGNNVWLAAYGLGTQTGASALEELPRGASTIVEVSVGGVPETSTASLHDLAFDSAGNLWSASDATGGSSLGSLLMISSNNSLTAPAFGYTSTPNPQLYLGGGGSHSWAPLIDGSGNAWVGSETELNEVPSTGSETGGAGLYNASYTLIYGPTWEAGVERNDIEDGDGKFIVAAASGGAGYISVYYPNAPTDNDAGAGEGGADVYLNPCYVATGTTCDALAGGQAEGTNTIRGIAIDATGAIWASNQEGTATNLIQVLGPGAPSWGQRSWIPAALAPNLAGNATSLRPF